ncbi:hypothetical protein Tco_0337212 [Tanacetum coccineum]
MSKMQYRMSESVVLDVFQNQISVTTGQRKLGQLAKELYSQTKGEGMAALTSDVSAVKFVRDFKSLAKEADESLAKHKTLELEIERLLRAVVSTNNYVYCACKIHRLIMTTLLLRPIRATSLGAIQRMILSPLRLLVVATRIKKVDPICLWNRSIIHRRFNKTPYELNNSKKPDISFLQVFGALCYPKNDREDIGKLGAKVEMAFSLVIADIPVLTGFTIEGQRETLETMNVTLMIFHQAMSFDQSSSKPVLKE